MPASFLDGDTEIDLDGNDESLTVPLPFPFTFYGRTYDSVGVTTNGFVNFLPSPFAPSLNTPIPAPEAPNAAIYALWADLFVGGGASMRTGVLGSAPDRQFVIEWRNVRFRGMILRLRFEIVLRENGEILLQYAAPVDDPLQRGATATLGIENDSGTVGFQYSFQEDVIDPALAILFSPPRTGQVEGLVTDANDGQPLADVEVRALRDGVLVGAGQTNALGRYRLQLLEGSYLLEAGRDRYGQQQSPVEVLADQLVTRDFSLPTARAEFGPGAVRLVVRRGEARTRTVSLRNTGGLALEFSIAEAGGQAQATAPTSRPVRNEAASPTARTTRDLWVGGSAPRGWSPSAPGNVIRSFVTEGVTGPFGLGFEGNLWVSEVQERAGNFEFTSEGQSTGRQWPSPWAESWAGDMAHDPNRKLICQLAVGGDNGIHCWDPASGALVDSIVGEFPWTARTQRGLAYRADDDSFYLGGWVQGAIYHVKGLGHPDRGAVIGVCTPADSSISGLAWNAAAGVLWAATNSPTDSIYELDPEDCTVLAVLAHPAAGGNQGGGLELDERGNLWMVAQNIRTVFLVESGVPELGDIPWLSVTPSGGTVAPGQEGALEVTVNSGDLAAGTYLGSLVVTSNAGRERRLRIPVSLVVTEYQQGVNAGGGAYQDALGDTWAADRKHSAGSWGYLQSSRTRTTSHEISGTADPRLYQSQRINPYAYRFDSVPNGVYQVDLRFAELENLGAGGRLFDVVVEDTLVLPSYDVAARVGNFAADAHTFFVEVTDGRMDIRLIPDARRSKPVLNALRITHRPDR